MTRSVNTDRFPDADYKPSDMGPVERTTTLADWDTFSDEETNQTIMLERDADAPF